jgi:hypothetical protein
VRPTRRADTSAVLVAPNVEVRMEAQHYIPSLHDLLGKPLPLPMYVIKGFDIKTV